MMSQMTRRFVVNCTEFVIKFHAGPFQILTRHTHTHTHRLKAALQTECIVHCSQTKLGQLGLIRHRFFFQEKIQKRGHDEIFRVKGVG